MRRVAGELAARDDTEVEVWTVDRGEHLGERELDGIRVRYLPTPLPARNARSMLGMLKAAPPAWHTWSRARREFRPELLHVHCFGPNGVYALALARRSRLPLAVTSHGETIMDDHRAFARSALLRRSLTAAIERSAFVTAPSDYVLRELRGAYGLADGTVVPNGVVARSDASTATASSSAAARTLPALDDPRPFIAAVGRLGHPKGFDLLLDAFARAELPGSTRLLIGGDGPERAELERRIAELGLSDRVRLLGRLDAAEVDAVMRRSLAVVVPSRVEAFGIVALEAWRAGAALVMTSRGGAPEFVRDGIDGLLVDPLDVTALSSVLRRVHDDVALRDRLAAAGAARVEEFAWPRVAAAYRELYEEI